MHRDPTPIARDLTTNHNIIIMEQEPDVDPLVPFRAAIMEMEKNFLELLDNAPPGVHPRWLAIGRTHIEEGRMALIRSTYEKPKASSTTQKQT